MKEPQSKKQKVSPDTYKMKLSNPMILKYWKVPGRGEAIRVMLHVAKGAKWQNQYIGFETWGEEKKIAPLGCLPTLKMFDDPNIPPFCQSTALARYAAKQAGYYPNNDLDALIVDEVLETINELTSLLPSEEDRDEKKVKRAEFQAKTMTTYAELLESRIKTFGEGKRVVKSGWTVADVSLWALVYDVSSGLWDDVDTDFFQSYPGICATVKGIEVHVVKGYRDHMEADEK